MIVKLNPLEVKDIFKILKSSLKKPEGLGTFHINIEDSTLEKIAELSGGDVRTALNGLEVAVLTTNMDKNGVIHITDEIAAQSINKKKAMFDKSRRFSL